MSPTELGPVIVTGGSRGIGAATVEKLAGSGRPVAFSYAANDAAAEALCARITAAGGQALGCKGDAADGSAVDQLFAACRERFGPATGLFANAGITGPACRLEQLPLADLRRVLEVNVVGSFLATQAAIRTMSTNAGGAGGAIVLMSSRAAQLGGAGEWLHYAASKGAMDTLTVGLAREAGSAGIRVNAVAPGLIDTDIHAAAGLGDRLQQKANEIPLGRIGTATEVAEAVCWLLSPAAAYVNGTIINVGGGR